MATYKTVVDIACYLHKQAMEATKELESGEIDPDGMCALEQYNACLDLIVSLRKSFGDSITGKEDIGFCTDICFEGGGAIRYGTADGFSTVDVHRLLTWLVSVRDKPIEQFFKFEMATYVMGSLSERMLI